jgi:tRNA threonylcarbamoyladenosine modification (KEOPS) complex Cgi121 subunit
MRFALTTQISDAIRTVGIKSKTNFFIIAIGNKKTLHALYLELIPISTNIFSKNNETHLKKHFKITKRHTDSIYSKNPLADLLIEKAAVLL